MNKYLGLFLLILGMAIGYYAKEIEIKTFKKPVQSNTLEDRPIKYDKQFDIVGARTTKYHQQLHELGIATLESDTNKMNKLTYALIKEGINPKSIHHVPLNTPTEYSFKEQLKGIYLKGKQECAIVSYRQGGKDKFYVACK